MQKFIYNEVLDNRFAILKIIHNNGVKCQILLAKPLQSIRDGTQTEFAVKAISINLQNSQYDLKQEFEIMRHLNHENIIKSFEFVKEGNVISRYQTFQPHSLQFFTMEYCPHGDLLKFMQARYPDAKQQGPPQAIIRQMLHQIINGLCFVHQQGFCHRDLKLDNLLISQQGLIKLVDFGCAARIYDQILHKEKLLHSHIGTASYMAPEIVAIGLMVHRSNIKEYNGTKVDVFSLGVILFTLIFNQQPFSQADKEDSQYRNIMELRYEQFWQAHSNKLALMHLYEQVAIKELLNRMLSLNPNERPDMQQVLASQWMQMEACSMSALREFLFNNNPTNHENNNNRNIYKSGNDDNDDQHQSKQSD